MNCLDSIRRPLSPALLVLALALAGCSDDGFAPADPDATGTSGTESTPATTATTDATETLDPTDPDGTDSTTSSSTNDESTGASDSSGSGTTGDVPVNTCEVPRDCVLVNDCCQCAAAHVDDEIPECTLDCDQSSCDALGIPDIAVVCDGGKCELDTHDCSGNVACDSLPPKCPPGTLPEVGPDAGGGFEGCWTGACIPLAACDPVPGCEHCQFNQACVQDVTQLGGVFSCKTMPEDCNGVPTCECMPPDTCEEPFDFCTELDGVILCECPAC